MRVKNFCTQPNINTLSTTLSRCCNDTSLSTDNIRHGTRVSYPPTVRKGVDHMLNTLALELCTCFEAQVLYTNIDLKLRNKSHGPMHCKIGVTCVYKHEWTRVLYSVVLTRQSNPPILQFNSPCNKFTSVWSMFVYNNSELNKVHM